MYRSDWVEAACLSFEVSSQLKGEIFYWANLNISRILGINERSSSPTFAEGKPRVSLRDERVTVEKTGRVVLARSWWLGTGFPYIYLYVVCKASKYCDLNNNQTWNCDACLHVSETWCCNDDSTLGLPPYALISVDQQYCANTPRIYKYVLGWCGERSSGIGMLTS